MLETLVDAFQQYFGLGPTYITRAPGRVNLIGEHTDYNDGFVLPMAINRHVWVAARPRQDNMLNVYSLNFNSIASFGLDQLEDKSLPHWTEHLRGVWYMLEQRGLKLSGADVLMHGDIPIGAGLSSSAAMELAMIELGLVLSGGRMSPTEKALFGVDIEHKFIGMPCGIMDQMASAVSEPGHALLIDCRSLSITPVAIPQETAVVVMDTGKRRRLVDAAYAQRRKQCEEASAMLGVSHLRDATLPLVEKYKEALGDARYRRARHIVSENQRVLDMVNALQSGNLDHAGQLMNQSHMSLRNDYEVSCFELDEMSQLARQHPDCFGARMTGAGFGGCAVALVQPDNVQRFIADVSESYTKKVDLTPALYLFEPSEGSSVLKKPEMS